MKRLLLGTILIWLMMGTPAPGMAGMNVGIGISLPPIVFNGAPYVVVMPEADDVYFVPDIEMDLFFWSGWWWRPWQGYWYRSLYYDRGWRYYNGIPSFYFGIDPGWRKYYRHQDWYGHRWKHRRIPYHEFKQNWERWRRDRYWEKHETWGVQKYRPRPEREKKELRRQREEQYRRSPEFQQEQRRREPEQYQRKPEIQQPPREESRHREMEQNKRSPEFQQEQRHREPEQYQRKPEIQQPPREESRRREMEQNKRSPEFQQEQRHREPEQYQRKQGESPR